MYTNNTRPLRIERELPHDEKLWDAIDLLYPKYGPLMMSAIRYLERYNVPVVMQERLANEPPFAISRDLTHDLPTISITMSDGVTPWQVSRMLATATKQIIQQDRHPESFSWHELQLDLHRSKPGYNLKNIYQLSPVEDAILLDVIAHADARAFSYMAVSEFSNTGRPIDQNEVTRYYADLAKNGTLPELVKRSVRKFQYLMDDLKEVERLYRKKPILYPVAVTASEIADVTSDLWDEKNNLASFFNQKSGLLRRPAHMDFTDVIKQEIRKNPEMRTLLHDVKTYFSVHGKIRQLIGYKTPGN